MASGSKEAQGESDSTSSPDFGGDEQPVAKTVKAVPALSKVEAEIEEADTGGEALTGGQGDRDKVQLGEGPEESKDKEDPPRPWVPKRVQAALNRSSTFDEYRKNRDFRFLRMFSGEKDQL